LRRRWSVRLQVTSNQTHLGFFDRQAHEVSEPKIKACEGYLLSAVWTEAETTLVGKVFDEGTPPMLNPRTRQQSDPLSDAVTQFLACKWSCLKRLKNTGGHLRQSLHGQPAFFEPALVVSKSTQAKRAYEQRDICGR
jgi:hypothetical protein